MVKRCLECGYDNSDTAEACISCGSTLIEVAADRVGPGPLVMEVPPGSGAVRPFVDTLKIRGPPRAKLSFSLCFIATLLVTLNAVLVGSAGVFPVPVSIYPFSTALVPWDVVGVVVGFWMLIGCILVLARKEIYGSAFIVFLSLVSLGVGGGFTVGFVVGIIGGLMALFKK